MIRRVEAGVDLLLHVVLCPVGVGNIETVSRRRKGTGEEEEAEGRDKQTNGQRSTHRGDDVG